MESLGQYLERILHQRKLSPKEAAKKCGITDSYIGRIINGKGGKHSVETILALADGLELNPHEVFSVATGRPMQSQKGLVDPLFILDLIRKILTEPRGLEVLERWMRLSKRNQEKLIEFIQFLNEGRSKKLEKPRKK